MRDRHTYPDTGGPNSCQPRSANSRKGIRANPHTAIPPRTAKCQATPRISHSNISTQNASRFVMPTSLPLKTGESVAITYEGRTVRAEVRLASRNGRSLVLVFEANLGGYAGMMPVFIDEDGSCIDLLYARPVAIERLT